jgi:hypothetical protein
MFGNLLGLLWIGTTPAMIVRAPLIRPEVPMPETARPMISAVEELATPQMIEPSSKTPKKVRNTI